MFRWDGFLGIFRGESQNGSLKLSREDNNPVISPKPKNDWEASQTFNPGAVLLSDKVHFFYRAIGRDGVSRLGYAASEDGFLINERSPCPVYEHGATRTGFSYYSFASGGSFGGAEDPRLTRVGGEDVVYMIYTAVDQGLRVGLTSIGVDDLLARRWRWKHPQLISPPGEVHKNWVIFPEKIGGKYAILHSICPEVTVAYRDSLEFGKGEYMNSCYDGDFRRKGCWDNWLRGAGAPPLKTEEGWLVFYHAMDNDDPGRYKVGTMLLDLEDPTRILHRSQEPVLEPKMDYENNGFKAGVVYVSGAVVKDGTLLVYYGASDSYTGVAYVDLEEFLEELTSQGRPSIFNTLKTKILC